MDDNAGVGPDIFLTYYFYFSPPPPCVFVQRRQAEFFQKIIRELRVEPEFFMVGYYGKGFPLFLRVCPYLKSVNHIYD